MNKCMNNQKQDAMVLFLTLWFMSQEEYKGEKIYYFMVGLKMKRPIVLLSGWLTFGKLSESFGHILCLGQSLMRCRAQWRMDLVGEHENNFFFFFLSPRG